MRRRTLSQLIVQSSLLGALSLTASCSVFDACVVAQEAPAQPAFKQKEVRLKSDKDIQEKTSEKNKARNGKTDKFDLAPLDLFYNDYLIPLLASGSPEAINRARKEIVEDIETLEKNKELAAKFNLKFIPQMREIVFKGSDGRVYSPQSRLNAALLLVRLNESVNNNGVGKPEPKVLGSVKDLLEQKENDGLASIGLSALIRQLKANADPKTNVVSDENRTKFVQILQVHLTAPASLSRTPESQNYLTEQVLECLTEIAKFDPEKGAAKLATAALSPALVKIIDAQESEWLVESALISLGSIKTVGLTPEDAVTLEKAIAKFTRQSIKDWRKRITSSGPSAGGVYGAGGVGGEMGGYGSEMGGPGQMGGDGYGAGAGGSGKGGGGGSGKGGSSEGGYGEMGMGGAGATIKKKNPFELQPKEVRNARRIAHQRFERIHLALNGAMNDGSGGVRRTTSTAQPSAVTPANSTEEKALLSLISSNAKEKGHVLALIAKVEQFQKDLNSEKIADLNSLTMTVRKSISDIRAACDAITGATKEEVSTETDDLEISSR